MNEWILNSSVLSRVAEILRRACKSRSRNFNGGRLAIAWQKFAERLNLRMRSVPGAVATGSR